MSQTATKLKKLWGNPKVFMSATDLIIAERYYTLTQTLGAYVEPVPEEAAKPKVVADTPSGFRKTLLIVSGIIVLIFVMVFVAWWYDDFNSVSSGGISRKYHLVLINLEFGPVIVLEHTNQKKLAGIANQVNQALLSKGITPQTGYSNMISVTR